LGIRVIDLNGHLILFVIQRLKDAILAQLKVRDELNGAILHGVGPCVEEAP